MKKAKSFLLLIVMEFIVFFSRGTWAVTWFLGLTGAAASSHSFYRTWDKNPGQKNILVAGVDARRPQEPAQADTIMVAFCNLEKKTVDILSVPRDTRVEIAGEIYHHRKINHAQARGGPELLQATVEKLLGIKIDGWVVLDFRAFKRIIDILGGVTINVEKRMLFPAEDIDLYPGEQILDGRGALAYVRYRGDGQGDVGRIPRQQKFVKALAREVLSVRALLKSPALIAEVCSQVDTDLSYPEILVLAKSYADTKDLTICTYMLPGEHRMIGNGRYWLIDPMKAKRVANELNKSG